MQIKKMKAYRVYHMMDRTQTLGLYKVEEDAAKHVADAYARISYEEVDIPEDKVPSIIFSEPRIKKQ